MVLANPPVLDQAMEPRGLAERPVGPQLPRHAAAGPRRLRLLPAHPEEPGPEDRPLRDPLPARRSVPQRRSRDAAQAGRVGSARCVLGLGPNLFYNSPMEACVVICRTQKPAARRGKVLFIDAVNEVSRERAQSFLNIAASGANPAGLSGVYARARVRGRRDEPRDPQQ